MKTQDGTPHGRELYPLPTGSTYMTPRWTPGTNFLLISSLGFSAANDKRLYRVYSDRVTGYETFTTGANSQTFGALFGKPWLVVSLDGTTNQKLYDYTNGHQAGTNSALQTHIKDHAGDEKGFISPEDTRKDYYVVAERSSKKIYTVKQNGVSWLSRDLQSLGSASGLAWIKDTKTLI